MVGAAAGKMSLVHGGRGADRLLAVAALTAALLLVGGLVLLGVMLATESVEIASSWGSVLGTVLADAIALITLGTWWLRRNTAAGGTVSKDVPDQAQASAPPRADGNETSRRPVSRRRVLLAAGMCVVLVALTLAVSLSSTGDEPNQSQTFTGVPRLPTSTGRVALTDDARTVDLCRLVNLAWLRQFGEPRVTDGTHINGCQVHIDRPGGGQTRIDLIPQDYKDSAVNLDGRVQPIDGLSVVRDRPNDPEPPGGCRRTLVLTDETVIYVVARDADSDTPAPADVCRVAEVVTAVAVRELARAGLPHNPGRTATYSLARADACFVLTPQALGTVPGLEVAKRQAGFAHWTCDWGADEPGKPTVRTQFRLDMADLEQDYGDPAQIGGENGFLRPAPELNELPGCTASIEQLSTQTSTTRPSEIFSVTVWSAESEEVDCQWASSLAALAQPTLVKP